MKESFRLNVFIVCVIICINPVNAQWVQSNGPYGGNIRCLVVSGTNIFAGTGGGGVFLSIDKGANWTAVNTGLANTNVYSLAVSGTNLYAGTNGGVFLSTDNGTNWKAINTGLTNTYVTHLATSGTNLFAGTLGGVFLSTNNGTSWTAVNTGLTNTITHCLAVSGTNLFVGTDGGVFLSTNNGTSWTAVNSGLVNSVHALSANGAYLFAGTFDGGISLSTINGTSWTAVNTGLTNMWVRSLAFSGTNLFAGTNGSGALKRPMSEMVTVVDKTTTNLPAQLTLEQNYPNPFNPSTIIPFSLPSKTFVSLKIFDVMGREASTLLSDELHAGSYSHQWNASAFPSGMYFYRLQAGSCTETKRLIIVR